MLNLSENVFTIQQSHERVIEAFCKSKLLAILKYVTDNVKVMNLVKITQIYDQQLCE